MTHSPSPARSVSFGSFRVDFVPRGDRIAHAVFGPTAASGANPGGWRELVRSVEGAPHEAWPDSPPLQELHVENRNGESVALLVGRAGKSHWSASIGSERRATAARDSTERLVVDVACRVAATPALLGNAYELADGIEWMGGERLLADDSARWRSIALFARSGLAWQLSVDEESSIIVVPGSRRIRVTPRAAAQSAPTTIRWQVVLAADRTG